MKHFNLNAPKPFTKLIIALSLTLFLLPKPSFAQNCEISDVNYDLLDKSEYSFSSETAYARLTIDAEPVDEQKLINGSVTFYYKYNDIFTGALKRAIHIATFNDVIPAGESTLELDLPILVFGRMVEIYDLRFHELGCKT